MQTPLPKRKSVRLKNYDYAQNGFYFITICTQNRQCLFGEIENGKMMLNEIGDIVRFTWADLINHNDIKLHEFVIMPNHVHGIIEICCRERFLSLPKTTNYRFGVPEIMRQFKTFSSKRINEYLKRNGLEPFPTGALWQKSYYEHIIRNEADYARVLEYMDNNPLAKQLQSEAERL